MELALASPQAASRRLIALTHSATDRARNPHIARDEFRTLKALRQAGLPVAQPLHVDESHQPPFLLTTALPGAPRTDPQDEAAFCKALAAALADIHDLDLQRHHLAHLPSESELITHWLEAPSQRDNAIAKTLKCALDNIARNPPALLHGDFWPGNLLWQSATLTGIVDWEDARLGDPLSDLGKCRLELLWALGAAAMAQFTACYLAQNSRLDAGALPFWDLWGAARLSHFASFTANDHLPRRRRLFRQFVVDAMAALRML